MPCRRQPALPLLFIEVLLICERFLSILDADDAVLVWFGFCLLVLLEFLAICFWLLVC